MNTEQPQHYERLPGLGRLAMAYSTLWLGEDHLLSVTTISFTQEYKRFYFADIQAFIVRRTNIGAIWNLVWGLLASLFILIVLTAEDALAQQALGGIAVVCLAGLAINAVRGPTCVSHIRTAVQTERLPSLHRLRNALRVANRLQPVIAAAQSTWPTPSGGSSPPAAGGEAIPPGIEGSPPPPGPGVPGEGAAGTRP